MLLETCAPPSTRHPAPSVVSGPTIARGWTTVSGVQPRRSSRSTSCRRISGEATPTRYADGSDLVGTAPRAARATVRPGHRVVGEAGDGHARRQAGVQRLTSHAAGTRDDHGAILAHRGAR